MGEMTDGEVLVMLRGYFDWPARLDALAVQAASIGRLAKANARPKERTNGSLVASSISSVTIAPLQVPNGNYNNLPNRSAMHDRNLEGELRYVLGMPANLTSHDDD
jgi:hypothetical protein